MTTYNGWTNRETWLVNLWYGDDLATMLAEDERNVDVGIGPHEAEEWVRYVAEESEVLSQPPTSGLLSDFLEQCWCEVNWDEIADALNEGIQQEIA